MIDKTVSIPTNRRTIPHPNIGIQTDPSDALVNNEPKKDTKNEIEYPTPNCNPIPPKNHFLLLISEFY